MENKLKRFLSVVLALVMVIGLLPVNRIFAEGTEGAAEPVEVTTYSELVTQLQAGASVVLMADISMDSSFEIAAGTEAVLDLNGKRITNNRLITVRGKLTVKDSAGVSDMISDVYFRNYGELVIEGGNFSAGNNNAVWGGQDSVTTITGGTFMASMDVIRIKNGTLTLKNAEATGVAPIYLEGSAVATVYSGTYVSNTDYMTGYGLIRMYGTSQLTVEGGTFSGEVYNTVCAANTASLKITGGNFETHKIFSEGSPEVEITGGKFHTAFINEIKNEGYLPEGYTITDEGLVVEKDDSVTVTKTVTTAEELTAAVANGGNIRLGADFAVGSTVTVSAGVSVNLDMNGKTLTFNTSYGIVNRGTLTVTDTSEDAKGTITSRYIRVIENYGKLTLEKGNYYTADGRLLTSYEGSKIVINGGTYESATGTALCSGGTTVIDKATMRGRKTLIFDDTAEVTLVDPYVTSTGTQSDAAPVTVHMQANVTIQGGDYIRPDGSGVAIVNTTGATGKLVILDGNFEAELPFDSYGASGWSVEIKGGTFTGKRLCFHGGSYKISGGIFNLSRADASVSAYRTDMTISGGEFNVTGTNAKVTVAEAHVTVTGGKFSESIQATVAGYLADGYKFNAKGSVKKEEDFVTVTTAEELDDALTAGKQEVVLGADFKANYWWQGLELEAEKNVVIDLNGHTLTTPSEIVNYGTLSIIDSARTESSGGQIVAETVFLKNYGTAVIDGVKLNGIGGGSMIQSFADSKVTVQNSELVHSLILESKGETLIDNVKTTSRHGFTFGDGANAVIRNVEMVATGSGAFIGLKGSANVTVESGNFSETQFDAVFLHEGATGKLTVNGGNFQALSLFKSGMDDYGGTSWDVVINGGSFTGEVIELSASKEASYTFKGGEFNCSRYWGDQFVNWNDSTVVISGGKYSSGIWTLAEPYLAEGYYFDENGCVVPNENVTVVTNEEELRKAVANGGKIKLGENILHEGIEHHPGFYVEKDVVFDLNGYTVNCVFTVNPYAKDTPVSLTVKDSSEDKTGLIHSWDTALKTEENGTIIIEGGNFTSEKGCIIGTSGGNVRIDGGTFNSQVASMYGGDLVVNDINAAGGISTNSGNVTINGGSFCFDAGDYNMLDSNGRAFVINGGTFTNTSASERTAILRGGNGTHYEINGGIFTCPAGGMFWYSGIDPNTQFTSSITDGTFRVQRMDMSYEHTITGGQFFLNHSEGRSAVITGGTFSRPARAAVTGALKDTDYELDSYGNVVRKGQTGPVVTPPACGEEVVVNTEEELRAAMTSGKYAKLGENITVEGNIHVPAWVSTVLDLNGKTLNYTRYNNIYGFLTVKDSSAGKEGKLAGFAVTNYGELTVENGNVNTKVISHANSLTTVNGGTCGNFEIYGEAAIKGGKFVGYNTLWIGEGANVTIENAEIISDTAGTTDYFYPVVIEGNANVTIKSGTFRKAGGFGGVFAYNTYKGVTGSLKILDGTFDAGSWYLFAGGSGAAWDVEIKGGTFTGTNIDFYGENATYRISDGEFACQNIDIDSADVTVTGGEFDFSSNTYCMSVNDANFNIKGGTFSCTDVRSMLSGYNNESIKISGGEFNATGSENTNWFNFREDEPLEISGGKFAAVLQKDGEPFLAEGYKFDEDGYVVKIDSDIPATAVALVGPDPYDTLEEAMAAANGKEENVTVKLLKDVQIQWLSVWEGVTVDLSGRELEAEYVTAVGGIVDSVGGGLLKVAKDRIMLREGNPQLPVWDEDGFRFFDLTEFFHAAETEDGNVCYRFLPTFDPAAHELLKAGQETSGVRVGVLVSWQTAQGVRTQDFVYSDALVGKVLNSFDGDRYGKAYQLWIKDVKNYSELTYTAYVASDCGVMLLPEAQK